MVILMPFGSSLTFGDSGSLKAKLLLNEKRVEDWENPWNQWRHEHSLRD